MTRQFPKWIFRIVVAVLFALSLPAACAHAQAQSQAAYVTIEVGNGGSISGKVRWEGAVPKIPKLAISKDYEVCDPDSRKTRDLERLVIDANGNVANAVVYLKDVARGRRMEFPESRERLDQKTCRYFPHILIIPQGGVLQMKSSDAVLHTVHMTGAATSNVPFAFQNQFVPTVMHNNGVVDLKCNAGHVWMNAEILVVKHPYYAVTDERGNFKLTDIPPGDYELVAWHEGWKILREESVLDVAAQVQVRRPIYSEPVTWSKKVTVRPGQTSEVSFSIAEK